MRPSVRRSSAAFSLRPLSPAHALSHSRPLDLTHLSPLFTIGIWTSGYAHSWYVHALKKLTRSQSFFRDCSGTPIDVFRKQKAPVRLAKTKSIKKKQRKQRQRKKREKKERERKGWRKGGRKNPYTARISYCTRKKRLRMSLTRFRACLLTYDVYY